MKTELFDYPLPGSLIAQEPLPERDSSRLMVVERSSGDIAHRRFSDLTRLLSPGDCLVVNSSRVFPGRLHARKETGGSVELLLLERVTDGTWAVLVGGARLRPGVRLSFSRSPISAEVVEGPVEGKATVRFEALKGEAKAIDEMIFDCGTVPLPPYIKEGPADMERYQTVYSDREISAAAPTAGLHFTPRLLEELKDAGVTVASLELAVGLDTFLPVREEDIEDHGIHREWFSVDERCAGTLQDVRARGGRVVAVGTTVVRALETVAEPGGRVLPGSGRTGLFITPGYRFRAVDALVTNFHFPRTTLLMLACAFGGHPLVMDAYRAAVEERYRFYSFGDAMLVLR